MKFTYSTCGAEHDLAEISFSTDAPVQWELLSDAERSRSMLAGEQCEIQSDEGRSFYIRACLEIPTKWHGRGAESARRRPRQTGHNRVLGWL
jgi:hypothetical protein